MQYQWRSPAWSSRVPRTCPGGGLPHRERPRLVSGPAGALRRAPSPCEESPVSGLSGPRLARHPRRVTNCGRKERLSPPQRVSRPETDGVGDDHLGFKADRIAAWRTLGRASGTPPSRVRGAAPRGALMEALSAPRPRDLLLLKRTSGVLPISRTLAVTSCCPPAEWAWVAWAGFLARLRPVASEGSGRRDAPCPPSHPTR